MIIKDAVHLIDDDSLRHWGRICTGWDYVGDGEGPSTANTPKYWLLNSDKEGDVYVKRDVNAFEGGIMTYECKLENLSGDGLYFSLGSRDDAFIKLVTKKEALYIGKKKICGFAYGRRYIKLVIDMTKDTFEAIIDNKSCGTFDFLKPAFPMTCLKIGYGEKDTGAAGIFFNKLYVNYLFHDYNLNNVVGEMPDGFIVKAPKTASVTSAIRVEGKDATTYLSHNRKGNKTVTIRPFAKASGVVAFEMKYLMANAAGKMSVALCRGDKELVSVYDEGEELHCWCGCALRKHHKTVWQTLRFEADTERKSCAIWLDGKKTKVVDFKNAGSYIDAFKITYEATALSDLMFSDMKVWVMPPEPEDYVPAPIVPKKKGDYVVGMNICSLWREGTHSGWDCISPFDDVKPVLGYYDEGLPETADWEIKFLAEHGIDYELYCWYSSESSAPIKSTPLSFAWLDGHMHAKYSNVEKFALLWEAANCQHPHSLEDFKNNLVPYWLDYFFSDERYMRVDNKAIMSCFGVWCVNNDLGGAANVREGLQYLRDEVKKLGYDDLIVMGCHADPNELKNLGFDAFHAYHWGSEGYMLEHNIKSNDQNIAKNAVHIVPTVSVGFKNVGWGGNRRPLLACADMYKGLVHCMNEYLPKNEKGWKSKMLHVSTWNEYGEGTYMMPAGINGFGYLDAVRKAVCVDTPHEDIVPNAEQKARIGYLHLPDRHILQRTKYDVRPLPETDTLVKKYTFKTKGDLKKWKFTGIKNARIENDHLLGEIDSMWNGYIELKDCEFDASKIAYAKVTLTNRHAHSNSSNVFTLMASNCEDRSNFNRSFGVEPWVPSNDVISVECSLDDKHWWTNTIYGIRLIPVPLGTFELESIEFFAALPHKTLYGKSGHQLFFGDYLHTLSGEVIVPLDPASGILGNLGERVKFEWFKDEGRLELWDKNGNTWSIVLDRPFVVKNGEPVELLRPSQLKDGIPYLTLSDLKTLFGIDYEVCGDKIYLK